MNAPEQVMVLDRQKYLGGSDAAAYLGVSPWKTPVDLYLKKVTPTKEEVDPDRLKFFARRKRQEPVVAEMLFDTYGIEVTTLSLDGNPNRYKDAEHDFLAAEIDFEFLMTPTCRDHFPGRPDFGSIPDGTLVSGEIKTVHPFKASEWGEEGSEEVPIHYASQAMHGLMILPDRPACLVAALFGLDHLLAFPIMRDEETIAAMRAKAVSFWYDHVIAQVPPDPVNLDDVKKLFAKFKGKPVELSDEAYDAFTKVLDSRAKLTVATAHKDAAEFELAKFICDKWGKPVGLDEKGKVLVGEGVDDASLFYNGTEIGTWRSTRGTYLDQKRLALNHKAIVEDHTIEHHYRVIRAASKKGRK